MNTCVMEGIISDFHHSPFQENPPPENLSLDFLEEVGGFTAKKNIPQLETSREMFCGSFRRVCYFAASLASFGYPKSPQLRR